MIDERSITNWFTYHAPTGDQAVVYEAIRAHGREFAHIINNLVPDGPDKTVAIRTLREAVMWANAAVATGTVEGPADTAAAPKLAPARKATDGPYQTSTWPGLTTTATPPKTTVPSLSDLVDGFAKSRGAR